MDPFIKTNKIIMSAIGHWPYQTSIKNRIIRFGACSACLSLHIPIWIRLYESRIDFDDLLLCFPMAITSILYYSAFIFFVIKTPQMLILLDWMAKDYKDLESREAELHILKKSAAEGHFAVKIFARVNKTRREETSNIYLLLVYTGLSTIGYCLEALLPPILDLFVPLNETREKVQLAELDYVIFDVNASFYLPWAHVAFVGAFVIATIVSTNLMLYTFCLHACGMFGVLRYRLKHIKNIKNINDIDEMYLEGVACVKLYNRLLQYINLINSCYASYLFVSVGIEIMLMSFQGAMIIIRNSDTNLVSLYGTYYIAQLIYVLYGSIPGQKVLDDSRELSNHISQTEWYDMPPRVKKLLLMIIIRSIKESKVTIGNVFTLGIETFSSILKTIFSYLSVLTSMKA